MNELQNLDKKIVQFCKKIPENIYTRPLLNQLIRSETSVGANYAEANDAVSRYDFKNKIGICKKESREIKYFLKMIITTVPELSDKESFLIQEAKELNLIFNKIYLKIRNFDLLFL